jgi:hypothetical protein
VPQQHPRLEDGRDHVDEILRARLADLKLAREKAHAALERARSGTRAVEDISPIVIERCRRGMREKLTTGEVPSARPTLGRSSTASRWMTARFGLWAAMRCWNRPSSPPGKARPVLIVL